MKYLIILFFTLITSSLFGQNMNVFTDANFRLFQFNSGIFEKIYYQQTAEVFVGNEYVCFVDSKGDVFVIYEGEQTLMGQTYNDIHVTDNLLVMRTANVIRVFDRGIRHILTSNALGYGYGDSLVVFQDAIGGYVKYYYQDEVRDVAMVVGDYPFSASNVGSNVFVYRDNTGSAQLFWRGNFFNLLSTNQHLDFSCGQDVAAFNDPINGTFTVFDNGYVIDAEQQHAQRYQCGDNFIYYQDAGGVHRVYREERISELGYDLQNIIVRDSLVVFNDIGATKVWYNENIYRIYNSTVVEPQIDGGIMAFTNQWGGVNAFVRGKEIEITRQRVESFKLQGNTILLKFSRTAFAVWWNGKIYEF